MASDPSPADLASAVEFLTAVSARFYYDGAPKDAEPMAFALLTHARALGWQPEPAPRTYSRAQVLAFGERVNTTCSAKGKRTAAEVAALLDEEPGK